MLMKPSNYILNSRYATLAEMGEIDITLTIPANFTADGVRETVIDTPYPNALFRYSLSGGNKPLVIDGMTTISRNFNGVNRLYVVCVYRKDETHVSLACMTTDGKTVTGTSANTIQAKVHFFESPFEA